METKRPENFVGGPLSPAEARDIAKDAYIYGSPVVQMIEEQRYFSVHLIDAYTLR
jgi:hypothetical protein